MSKESRVSRVSSIQYKRGPEQAIKLHLCELEYWAICFSGSRLSHQCNHHTFVGLTCHWVFIFPAQEPEQFVWIVDYKTQLAAIYTVFRNYPNFLRPYFSGNFFVRCYLRKRKKSRGGSEEKKEEDNPEGIKDTCQVREIFTK